MSRRHTLILSSLAGTVALWGSVIALALTGWGSERLYIAALTGAFLAATTTVATLGLLAIRHLTIRLASELHDAVAQAADELHVAVAEVGTALRLDREVVTATRALMAELRQIKPLLQRAGSDRAA